jgi:hypothetical protein
VIDEEGNVMTFSVPNIHVSYGQHINLPKLWAQKGIQIPSDAHIVQTITRRQESSFDEEEILSFLVLFDRFHSYQFKMVLSKKNKIIKGITLEGVFYKYGSNIAASAYLGDYLVVKYILDFGYGKMEELYGCFDLTHFVVRSDLVKEHHHFSTYIFRNYYLD